MARTSMTQLITLVRDLIGDRAGADQVFSDDQIQRSLDLHRQNHSRLALTPIPVFENGEVKYYTWVAPIQYWEEDAVLYDENYTPISPSDGDYIAGRWTFANSQDCVFVSGKTYDPYGAAADLLEMWAGMVSVEFDFSADGATFHRSQKTQALQNLARQYRKHQRVTYGRQVRND